MSLIYISIPFFAISIIVESIYNNKKKLNFYGNKDTLTSLSMGIGNVVIETLLKGFSVVIFFWIYQYRLFEIPNIWWSWVLILFADDFSYYWFHRLSHKSRYFWASHIIHHTSKRYNLSTALRQTWTGRLSGTFIFWLWMPLIGFNPLMIFMIKSINLIYQFWIHTETIDKMPRFFEFIFNTPSHHRVHHGSDLIYVDKNYAERMKY